MSENQKKSEARPLQLGDRVTWRSQSGGYRTVKSGVIAQIVPAGFRPDPEAFPQLYKGAGCGYGRNHDSFVVLVGGRPYWPRASVLQKVQP